MNVIITGATGFVGGEVVHQAIANDRIRHAFVLTRKPLPDDISKNGKITVIEHEDFSTYPPDLLQQLAGAEACIWAIGGRASQFPDVETARKVSVDFTIAAAKAFLAELAPQPPDGKKFRFVFCSGKLAEWDDEKHLRFMSDTRHIKGQVEKGLCELADANPEKFEVLIVRPGGITAKGGRLKATSANLMGFITVDHLARDMLSIVLDGHAKRILESDVLINM
ncbi:hypothetical protein F5X99DRAFT_403349 [Biscogniauxia marginata]|nr:hypothetical protein F5X99DRAFT_403349 [Biscogniauxia marginata]